MDIIIPKNSKIPFEKTEKYKTADDNQTKAKIIIYQGVFIFRHWDIIYIHIHTYIRRIKKRGNICRTWLAVIIIGII